MQINTIIGGTFMKKRIFIGTLCVLLVSLLASCNNSEIKEDMNSEVINSLGTQNNLEEEKLSPTPIAVKEISTPTAAVQPPVNNEESNSMKRKVSAKSPDGKMEAEVITEKDKLHDSIIVTDKNNNSSKIELENMLYTGIMGFSWIDNTRVALLGHVNPSLNRYIVVDAYKKEVIKEYNGLGFTWNKNKNKLYYVVPKPHFAVGEAIEQIVDSDGHVYYETKRNETLTDTLAISQNEQNFVFLVNKNDNSRKLIIAKLGADKKLEKKSELDVRYGDIEFKDNVHFTITDSDGNALEYSVNE